MPLARSHSRDYTYNSTLNREKIRLLIGECINWCGLPREEALVERLEFAMRFLVLDGETLEDELPEEATCEAMPDNDLTCES